MESPSNPGQFRLPDDVDEAVRARLRRQELLYRPDKHLHFVVTEAALRNVKLGVIGFETRYVISPRHGFWIFDEDLVSVETHSAGLHLAQPQEIELYGRVFDQLAAVASYASEARAIILRVIDDLAARSPEDGL